VKFNQESGALKAGKRVFRRGQTLKVKVSKVDIDARKLDFVPVQ
jgi:exoribonuclease R